MDFTSAESESTHPPMLPSIAAKGGLLERKALAVTVARLATLLPPEGRTAGVCAVPIVEVTARAGVTAYWLSRLKSALAVT